MTSHYRVYCSCLEPRNKCPLTEVVILLEVVIIGDFTVQVEHLFVQFKYRLDSDKSDLYGHDLTR